MVHRRPAVVLLSGGMDSATVLAMAVRDGFAPHALTIRYGQRHEVEIERARLLARDLGAERHVVEDLDLRFVGGSSLTDPGIEVPQGRTAEEMAVGIPSTYVPARNTIFLSLALAWAETLSARDLFIGVNAVDYSGYPDCRPEFLEAFEELARRATKAGVEGDRFRIHAPLLNRSKAEIVHLATELGVDLAKTLSCYAPSEAGDPCGRCDACHLREKGFRDAGLLDPAIRR